MPLTNDDWRAIEDHVSKMLTGIGEPFIQGKVVKNDPLRKLVWLKEFGDTPVPVIGFDYQVKYYIKEADGTTTVKKTPSYSKDVEILIPKVGEIVLVAQHFGSRRLPKCLGVIKSKNFIQTEGD